MAVGGRGACEGLSEGNLDRTVPGCAVGRGQVSVDDTGFPERVRT